MPDNHAVETVSLKAQQSLCNYDLGITLSSASQHDQRFSYCLYVPPQYTTGTAGRFKLLVAMHGSDRQHQQLLSRFRAFADAHDYIILAPLFPARIADPDDLDNYKYLEFSNIRFDLALLDIVAEVAQRYGADWSKFSLFGFSGGAHFVHRFLLLHAACLDAVSIASPGSVTRIDDTHGWWVGTADLKERFGCAPDIAAMKQVAIHLAVGADDTSTKAITHPVDGPRWMKGANDAGKTRIDRLRSLLRNYQAQGLEPEFELLPGVAHQEEPLAAAAMAFFSRRITSKS